MALKKWKIIVPVGIMAVIAFLVVYSQFGFKASQPQYTTEQTPTKTQEETATEEAAPSTATTPPTATGNVDDVITALLQDSSNEALVFQEESGDADLIAADSQTISDFGQSYDENEF